MGMFDIYKGEGNSLARDVVSWDYMRFSHILVTNVQEQLWFYLLELGSDKNKQQWHWLKSYDSQHWLKGRFTGFVVIILGNLGLSSCWSHGNSGDVHLPSQQPNVIGVSQRRAAPSQDHLNGICLGKIWGVNTSTCGTHMLLLVTTSSG